MSLVDRKLIDRRFNEAAAFSKGPALPLTRFADERIFRFSASPDQKRWAIVRGNIASDVVLVSERE